MQMLTTKALHCQHGSSDYNADAWKRCSCAEKHLDERASKAVVRFSVQCSSVPTSAPQNKENILAKPDFSKIKNYKN